MDWLKQTHRYEPLSDKRDLDSLQREHARMLDKRQQIDGKAQEIDNLMRLINRYTSKCFVLSEQVARCFSSQFESAR